MMEERQAAKFEIPLDIVLSLFTDEQIVMGIAYATAYAAKHGVSARHVIAACERELRKRERESEVM